MNKLLVVCGPTATGKTDLAISLAKKYNGELVSADSRQIYKGLDIGTGKDLEKFGDVKILGYDLVDPSESFSVANYATLIIPIIQDIQKRGKLPILVGGTGLYIQAIVDGIETMNVPTNIRLRKELSVATKDELFEILEKLNAKKALSMNESDRQNPRRLIRAIEICKYLLTNKLYETKVKFDTLMIGILVSVDEIISRISKRVQERIDQGFDEEVEKLLKNPKNRYSQALNSFGYKQWVLYMDGLIDRDAAVRQWLFYERQYAKRQITWFQKEKRVNWLSVNDTEKVEKLIDRWYYGSN